MAAEQQLDTQLRETAEELQLAVSLLVRHMRMASAGSGVTLSQISVLKRLDRDGPSTVTDLAKAEKIRPQSLNSTVSGLQADGYVERTPHPTDGRQRVITLTDLGHRFLRERKQAGHGRLAELMARRLTTAELQMVTSAVPLLRRLAES
ncbi:MarR family winged helix-turn-helix transcriptional regulator [Streptomyces sp. NBC_00096]|uniref:MarR family winged helix-turn-helix transcriptional regulator n=1 Tax=Streptomyces sp. NBC_00096 TaxID=2975650 RepID=UPI003244B483